MFEIVFVYCEQQRNWVHILFQITDYISFNLIKLRFYQINITKNLHPTDISFQTQLYTVFDENLDKQRTIQYILYGYICYFDKFVRKGKCIFLLPLKCYHFFVYEFGCCQAHRGLPVGFLLLQ